MISDSVDQVNLLLHLSGQDIAKSYSSIMATSDYLQIHNQVFINKFRQVFGYDLWHTLISFFAKAYDLRIWRAEEERHFSLYLESANINR